MRGGDLWIKSTLPQRVLGSSAGAAITLNIDIRPHLVQAVITFQGKVAGRGERTARLGKVRMPNQQLKEHAEVRYRACGS